MQSKSRKGAAAMAGLGKIRAPMLKTKGGKDTGKENFGCEHPSSRVQSKSDAKGKKVKAFERAKAARSASVKIDSKTHAANKPAQPVPAPQPISKRTSLETSSGNISDDMEVDVRRPKRQTVKPARYGTWHKGNMETSLEGGGQDSVSPAITRRRSRSQPGIQEAEEDVGAQVLKATATLDALAGQHFSDLISDEPSPPNQPQQNLREALKETWGQRTYLERLRYISESAKGPSKLSNKRPNRNPKSTDLPFPVLPTIPAITTPHPASSTPPSLTTKVSFVPHPAPPTVDVISPRLDTYNIISPAPAYRTRKQSNVPQASCAPTPSDQSPSPPSPDPEESASKPFLQCARDSYQLSPERSASQSDARPSSARTPTATYEEMEVKLRVMAQEIVDKDQRIHALEHDLRESHQREAGLAQKVSDNGTQESLRRHAMKTLSHMRQLAEGVREMAGELSSEASDLEKSLDASNGDPACS